LEPLPCPAGMDRTEKKKTRIEGASPGTILGIKQQPPTISRKKTGGTLKARGGEEGGK